MQHQSRFYFPCSMQGSDFISERTGSGTNQFQNCWYCDWLFWRFINSALMTTGNAPYSRWIQFCGPPMAIRKNFLFVYACTILTNTKPSIKEQNSQRIPKRADSPNQVTNAQYMGFRSDSFHHTTDKNIFVSMGMLKPIMYLLQITLVLRSNRSSFLNLSLRTTSVITASAVSSSMADRDCQQGLSWQTNTEIRQQTASFACRMAMRTRNMSYLPVAQWRNMMWYRIRGQWLS